MDIKRNRRDAVATGKVWDKTLPMPEGMYPTEKKGHGNAASDNNVGWDIRAQSWQRGADSDFASIEAEKVEQDARFGVPHDDRFPNPASQNPDVDVTLPSPANFSNNPGFMATSAGSAATSGAPDMKGGGSPEPRRLLRSDSGKPSWGGSTGRQSNVGGSGSTTGRSPSAGARNSVLPAAGDVDPGQEGGPQIVSSGYSG